MEDNPLELQYLRYNGQALGDALEGRLAQRVVDMRVTLTGTQSMQSNVSEQRVIAVHDRLG